MDFYDLIPMWVALPTFVVLFLGVSWGVLLLVRPWVRRVSAANGDEWDRVLGYAMASYGIFYGILLALITVSVYENFHRVDAIVLDEADAIGALYRAVQAYPNPLADNLHDALRQYTTGVITQDWPLQRQGVVPTLGNSSVERFQAALYAFEPATPGMQAIHSQTVGLYFDFLEARRARLDETRVALPALLWVVLGVGAVLNALMLALVESKNLRVHLIMSGILAVFVALLVFVTASMDHPYAGYVNVSPEPFQIVLDQLMTP